MIQIPRTLVQKIFKDDILTQASSLGFYTALAISPLLVLIVTFLSRLNLHLQYQLLFQVQNLVGVDAASFVESIINHTSQSTVVHANLWSIAILFISASAIFAQLQASLNVIFESPGISKNSSNTWAYIRLFLSRRLVCFGMILTFIFISIVSLLISGFLKFLAGSDLQAWLIGVHSAGDFLVYVLLFAVIFKWMPDRKVAWRAAFRGGFLTSCLFTIGKVLIGLYLSRTAVGSTYGAAGSFIVLLVWFYYSSLIFLVGAEISSFFVRQHPESI